MAARVRISCDLPPFFLFRRSPAHVIFYRQKEISSGEAQTLLDLKNQKKRLSCLFLLLIGLACSGPSTRAITAAQIGTPSARITGFMADWYGSEEEPAPGLGSEVIRDEALLTQHDEAGTCFQLTLRTESQFDEPFSDLEFACQFAESTQEMEATARSESVSALDYSETGQVETVWAEEISQDEYESLGLGEPDASMFRVVERTGEICCPGGISWQVTLNAANDNFDVNAMNPNTVSFNWTIQ